MHARRILLTTVAPFAAAACLLCIARPWPEEAPPWTRAGGTTLLSRLPVAFVPNVGQWRHSARYVARLGCATAFLEGRGWTISVAEGPGGDGASEVDPLGRRELVAARGAAVRMAFAGAGEPDLVAEDRLPGRHSYFLGNDPSRWRSEVPLYGAVRYRGVYPGIDVRAREQGGHFEYDVLLEPGAALEQVEIAVEGVEQMRLEGNALVLKTALGPLTMPAPRTWETGPRGEQSPLLCRYVLRGEDRFGFAIPGRKPGWAMVVDPGLVWSTFLGGTSFDTACALVTEAQDAVTVAGQTASASFPTTVGAYDTTFGGGGDAFVARLSSSGSSLVYATFLGGTGADSACALAVDAQGAATVAGQTTGGFPVTPGAFDTTYNGGSADGFIARLSPSGASLVFSTLLGGNMTDLPFAIALDGQGAVTIAGYTDSIFFPTTPGAFDTTLAGGDAFVTRLSSTGASLVYSTFLGGAGYDSASASSLLVDAQGNATVAGQTASSDYPTTPGAFDRTYHGQIDAFVTRLSPTGSTVVYSTFLGGLFYDAAAALALGAQADTIVVGSTYSPDFPTTAGSFDTTHNGGPGDAFVTRLSAAGSSLVYSTFLGGTGDETATAASGDAGGSATVAGETRSTGFPTSLGAFDTSFNGGTTDAFVTRLSPTATSLIYSTFLGGTSDDKAFAIGIDTRGGAVVAGQTYSSTFPITAGALDPSFNGSTDAFVTRLDLLPTGVSAFGRSSPGCGGLLAMSVTSMPQVGNAAFAFTCGNAPPSANGALLLAAGGLATPIPLLGVEVWVDPGSAWFLGLPAQSDATGAATAPVPIPPDPLLANQPLSAQLAWLGPTAPPPCPPLGISASNALAVTIQP